MIKSTEEIQELFPNTSIENVEQITNRGLVNEIYIVTTPNSKIVLRIDPEEEDTERFEKEKWCTDIALKNGILTTKILQIDLRKDNHPYMVMEYIEGEDGDKVTEHSSRIWNTLGIYAKKLHSIPVTGYGGEMVKPGVFKDSWENFLNYNISQLIRKDKALTLGAFTLEESLAIKNIFNTLKNKNLKLGLSHYDLAPKNTRIDSNGEIYLIDWGSASVLPIPYFDIAEILDESLEDTSDYFKVFLKGYGLSYEEYLEMKSTINQLNLLVYMDKLRWAMDRRPERVDHYIQEVQSKLKKIQL